MQTKAKLIIKVSLTRLRKLEWKCNLSLSILIFDSKMTRETGRTRGRIQDADSYTILKYMVLTSCCAWLGSSNSWFLPSFPLQRMRLGFEYYHCRAKWVWIKLSQVLIVIIPEEIYQEKEYIHISSNIRYPDRQFAPEIPSTASRIFKNVIFGIIELFLLLILSHYSFLGDSSSFLDEMTARFRNTFSLDVYVTKIRKMMILWLPLKRKNELGIKVRSRWSKQYTRDKEFWANLLSDIMMRLKKYRIKSGRKTSFRQ